MSIYYLIAYCFLLQSIVVYLAGIDVLFSLTPIVLKSKYFTGVHEILCVGLWAYPQFLLPLPLHFHD
jgi:hypothetical protein